MWRDGRLVRDLPLSRCSAAAHAASDAAKAAASHMVGIWLHVCMHVMCVYLDSVEAAEQRSASSESQASGNRSAVMSRLVLAQPAVWVIVASFAISCTRSTVPPSILAAADALSILHAPLAFLAMGMCAEAPSLGNTQHMVASRLAVCHLPALLTTAALVFAQQPVMAAAALLTSLGAGACLHRGPAYCSVPGCRHTVFVILLPQNPWARIFCWWHEHSARTWSPSLRLGRGELPACC